MKCVGIWLVLATVTLTVTANAATGLYTVLSIDLTEGERISAGSEELTFSTLWDGDAGATVTVKQDGVAIFSGLAGEGIKTWSVNRNGRYELTHTTYNNGVAGKVETAVFVVEGKDVPVSKLTIDWGQSSFVYDGQPKEPVITVKDGEMTLTNGMHYIVKYKDNVNVGIAKAVVKGMEPYSSEVTNTFEIVKASIGFPNCTYVTIDVSGGCDAQYYPVSGFNKLPDDGWADEYKTNRILLKKVPGVYGENGNPCYLGVFELTQRQWELVMGSNPSWFTNPLYYQKRPVEMVSVDMIRGTDDCFMKRMRVKTGQKCDFDLPSLELFVMACQAGQGRDITSGRGRFARGVLSGDPPHNSTPADMYGTDLVGSYEPNEWGYYDMLGNVQEFTSTTNAEGEYACVGGSWNRFENLSRSTPMHVYDDWLTPDEPGYGNGFRIAVGNCDVEPGSWMVPEGGISKYDAAYLYDGDGHTINTQALYAVTLTGSTPNFSFSLDGGTGWQNDPIVYTNVGEYVMWYKIAAPGYVEFKHQAKLTILEAPKIENAVARQRYPWNGLVDVDFDLSCELETAEIPLTLIVHDTVGGTNLPCRTLFVDGVAAEKIQVQSGHHRVTWNADADLPDGFECNRVSVEVKSE